MEIQEQTLVAELAAEHPGSIRVFQRHKIDFCCGGQRALAEVCAEHGLAFEDLRGELQAELAPRQPEERSWTSASLKELTEHIVARYHVGLRQELPRLEEMLHKVIRVHGEKHPEMLHPLGETFDTLRPELEQHMLKEEKILFPLVLQLEQAAAARVTVPEFHCGSIQNPIRAMESEHEGAGETLRRMRTLTFDYTLPEGACNTFRALFHGLEELEGELHEHIHLENNILHPRAAQLEGHPAAV